MLCWLAVRKFPSSKILSYLHKLAPVGCVSKASLCDNHQHGHYPPMPTEHTTSFPENSSPGHFLQCRGSTIVPMCFYQGECPWRLLSLMPSTFLLNEVWRGSTFRFYLLFFNNLLPKNTEWISEGAEPENNWEDTW